MIDSASQFFSGKFFHTPAANNLEVLNDTLLEVDDTGTIVSVLTSTDPGYTQVLAHAQKSDRLTSTSTSQFFLPGLIDLHIHAPQWPQLGKALHLPLEDWLFECTFPLEAKYKDEHFAEFVYTSLVENLIANGTTSAVYFATIHQRATELLAEICTSRGQRAWVGKVAMDDPQQCPDYYRDDSAQKSIEESEQILNTILSLPGNASKRVKPIITPRFIPACTDELLTGLGELAARHNCHIQTHCSESDWEHQFVIDRLGKTDTEALMDFGLLTRKTVLAHSNFLDASDMTLIARQQSGVAHCPYSNQYFADSVFPLRKALDKGLHVGLGTDISGGPSASMFDSCRQVIGVSRMLEAGTNPEIARDERGSSQSRSHFIEAFYLATAGGAEVLDEPLGKFEVGCRFDALMIDHGVTDSNILYFEELDTDEDLFQKTVYAATRSNIDSVWIDGRLVNSRNQSI